MRNIDINNEREFENSKVLGSNARASQGKFYWATEPLTNRHNTITNDYISGKRVLEVGCSDGSSVANYAQYARTIVGVDLSNEGIRIARSKNIPNAEFLCCDAHKLPFGEMVFDVVIVNSLLHHLDLKASLTEIHRVLKNDGVLIFREPLGINPLFQLYRYLTPGARTKDERPFNKSDLKLLSSFFNLERVSYYGFVSLISAVIRSHSLRDSLAKIDKMIAKTPIRLFFWQIAGIGNKVVRIHQAK